MSEVKVPEGLGNVTVFKPRLRSKSDAKRVLRLCAEGTEGWKGCNTAEGFILEADCRRADAIWNGVLDPDPGRPVRHDWTLIEKTARELAHDKSNRTALRCKVAERYQEQTGRYLASDSGTYKAKMREWLGPKS